MNTLQVSLLHAQGCLNQLLLLLLHRYKTKHQLWNSKHLKSINKDYKVPGIGFKVNQSSIKADKAPPKLGENTKTVLQTINFSEDEIEQLIKENIIS